MKTFYLKNIAVLFLISGCFAACDEESPEDRYFHCTMITDNSKVSLSFDTSGEYQNFVDIDWGDGKKESVRIRTFSGGSILHQYDADKATPHIITVEGPVEELKCERNQLTSLNASGPLLVLDCSDNLLTSLDLGRLEKLEWLYCYDNQLTGIDVSRNIQLNMLQIYDNQLINLDLSKNTKLRTLSVGSNQLTGLDVSRNIELSSLGVSNNQLTTLDVSNNIELRFLGVRDNQLTGLDISRNIHLNNLDVSNNLMDAESLNNLFRMLPDRSNSTSNIYITGNPGYSTCDRSIARSKGWSP